MYEELVNRLKNLATLEVKNGESDLLVTAEATAAIREIAQDAADAIEELQKAVYFHKYNSEFWEDKYNSLVDEKWIPVTEALPEEFVVVLCYCSRNDQYGCGEWVKEDNGTIYWSGLNGMIPTHWMPLPEPPKEET